MITHWNEWSDTKLTLHENRPGKADETFLGSVHSTGEEWVVCDANGEVCREPTQERAKRRLMQHVTGTRVEDT